MTPMNIVEAGYRYEGCVAFYETDAAGIVHFSNFLRYAECAETAALEACGMLEAMMRARMMLPRVQVQVEYRQPLRFRERYVILARVTRIGTSSLGWDFTIEGEAGLAAQLSWTTARLDARGQKAAYTDEERILLYELM